MKPFGHLILTIGFAVVLSGCFMHTVVGNGNGVRSPDSRFALCHQIHGASRKAYVDLTKKRVFIWIVTPPDVLLKRETVFSGKYVFQGADLCTRVEWRDSQHVIVDFYDFGDKVSSYDARKAGTPSNHVARVAFVLDAKTGKFVEKK
jgi:hypothetical protein